MASTVSKPNTTTSISGLTAAVGRISLNNSKPVVWVDTEEAVADVVDKIIDLPNNPPSLYIDLEGVRLSRLGAISIMQLYVAPLETAYLLDIHTLKSAAFTTPGLRNMCTSLKGVLESQDIEKVFFGVQNDSDALFSHYGIRLQGVTDLQLMELACRPQDRNFVNGLSKCIERHLDLSPAEKRAWAAGKKRGLTLFSPDRGGDYEVFNQRPLAPELKDYCVEDVRLLPRLWAVYDKKLAAKWRAKVRSATEARIRESQSATYNPHGPGRARAPFSLKYF